MHLIAILILILLLFLSIGGYVFFTACLRRKELPWFDKEKLSKTAYGKYYDCIISARDWLKDNQATEVYVNSRDGLKLHGYWVPAENAVGTILLCHGYRSTLLVDFCAALPLYHEMGLNILIPDQRSHGKSEGKYITLGVKECEDMLCWLDYCNHNLADLPILVSGLSMGASTVMYLADEQLPANIKGIIADCGFTSPKDIISHVFKKVTHLPATPFIWAVDLFSRVFAGFSLSQKDTRISLLKNTLPILMVHGVEDTFVPCTMTKESYRACTGEKELLLVDNAGHGVSFLVDTERYSQMIRRFIGKTILNQKGN